MSTSNLEKGRILLVDDDPNITAALMRGLAGRYQVFQASSARDGLRILEEEKPISVVVSDLRMPGMDGITFLSEVRVQSPDTVRILLTGCDADEKTALNAVNLGQIFRYLKKPCQSTLCRDEIENAYQHYLLRAEEKSRAARAEAEAASNRAKSEFLAAMSHEIRTPMNAVVALSSLLLETRLDADQEESVQIIRDSADGLLSLINDILDFSKIEAGAMLFERVPFQVRRVVESVQKMLTFKAVQKGISISKDIAEDIPEWVQGDPARLRQVLVNLLGNALKFRKSGGIGVIVLPEDASGKKDWVRFDVWDTGIGMDEETLSRIFTPYVQADASTAGIFGGTGLGLTISKRLTETMGGRLTVSSTLGEGSIFRFEIPLMTVSAPTVDSQTLDGSLSTRAESKDRASFRILVAEDNPVNQRVAEKILQKMGYIVDVVADGEEVLSALARTNYDLVLMDLEMPRLSGIDATRRIRAESELCRNSKIKIVGLTAHADASVLNSMRNAGMDGSLSKPVLPETLRAELLRHLA